MSKEITEEQLKTIVITSHIGIFVALNLLEQFKTGKIESIQNNLTTSNKIVRLSMDLIQKYYKD